MILSSPTRRVTCSRSRYSRSGIAYLRVTPVRSLKRATSILGDFAFSAAMRRRNSSRAFLWKKRSSETLIKIVTLLLRDRILIKVSEDLFFHKNALEELRRRMAAEKAKSPKMDVARFKDLTGVTRKYAIPLLEY